jgi:hypothetical protein
LLNYISLHPQDTADAIGADETAADAAINARHPTCKTNTTVLADLITGLPPVAPIITFEARLAAGFVYAAAEGIPAFAALGTALGPFVFIAVSLYLGARLGAYIEQKINAYNSAHNPACAKSDALIDPSGTVLDTNGNPVKGATVTILRADTSAGPFTRVPASSPGIEPAINPETTSSDGVFHWDVDSGWYEVRASAQGCVSPVNASQKSVTIGPYPVPPPQLGLAITLACTSEPPPAAPTVQSLSVSSGPASGGTAVTVIGTGFTPSSTVTFGGTAATAVTYISATALSVVSPPGEGLADVVVTTAGGSSPTSTADQFFYGSPPTVTGLSVTHGPASGGTTVTVTGTGFTGATSVGFGGLPAAAFTVESATQIQATTPAEPAGTVDVTVTTSAGGSTSSSADQFTFTKTIPTWPLVVHGYPNPAPKAAQAFYLGETNNAWILEADRPAPGNTVWKGTITLGTGTFSNVKPIDLEHNDSFTVNGKTISFVFHNAYDIDGIAFTSPKPNAETSVTFTLQINGHKAQAHQIFLGSALTQPPIGSPLVFDPVG